MRTLLTLSFGLAIAGMVAAQEHDWDHAHRVVGKAQEDLHRIEHRDAWAEADRGHYEAAERNLANVRKDLDGNRLDRGRLEATIMEVEHITHVDAIDRRAREVLTEDVRELRRLKDSWHWRD
jgi:hypothetical protein